jgi:hypothetical protein
MAQHVIDLEATAQQHQRAMAAEMRAAMEGLYASQAQAANRQTVAETVTRGFMDRNLAAMQRLLEAREAVAPAANIDSSVHTTTHLHQANMQATTQHNLTLNHISANLDGIGIQMQKNAQTQEQMITQVGAVVAEAERKNRASDAGMVFAMAGGGGQPPPGGGAAGMVRSGPYQQPVGNPQSLFPMQNPPGGGGPGRGPSGSSGAAAPNLAAVVSGPAQRFEISTPRGKRSPSPNDRAARVKDSTRGLGIRNLPTMQEIVDDTAALAPAAPDKRKQEARDRSATKKLQVQSDMEKAADARAQAMKDQKAETARRNEQKKNDAAEARRQAAVTKAKAKVQAEIQKEAEKSQKIVTQNEQLAKVKAAAAKYDADALAQGRAPKPKSKPRKSAQEKRKDMEGRQAVQGPQPPQPKPTDPAPDADPPPPPAPAAKAKAKAKPRVRRKKLAATTIAPGPPGEPGIVGGQIETAERGLFPSLPADLPVVAPKPVVNNRVSAKRMAALVASSEAKAPKLQNPTRAASKPKAVPSAAPASLISLIKQAGELPKGTGAPMPAQQRAARRRNK